MRWRHWTRSILLSSWAGCCPKIKQANIPDTVFRYSSTSSLQQILAINVNVNINILTTMHLPTLLSLLAATGALGFSSPAPINNTRVADTTLLDTTSLSALMGSADINLDDLASEEEGLAKRKAMTYCANQASTGGE